MKKIWFLTFITLIISLTACNFNDDETILQESKTISYSCTNVTGVPSVKKCSYIWNEYFDNSISLTTYSNYTTNMDDIYNHVDTIIKTYGKLLDYNNDYDGLINIHTINENPSKTHTINQEMYDLLETTINASKSVSEYYSITMGPVNNLWKETRDECFFDTETQKGYGTCETPKSTDLSLIKDSGIINDNSIILDSNKLTINLNSDIANLDLTQISNGYVSSLITDYLDKTNLTGYLLEFSINNVTSNGFNPTDIKGQFTFALSNPKESLVNFFTTDYFISFDIPDGYNIATSAEYQNYYKVGDIIYSDIISPSTLYPENEVNAITIIAKDDFLADLYADAVFSMSLDDGVEFINNIDDCEGIWYVAGENPTTSNGFDNLLNYKYINDNE